MVNINFVYADKLSWLAICSLVDRHCLYIWKRSSLALLTKERKEKKKKTRNRIVKSSADQMATRDGEITHISEAKDRTNESHTVGRPWSTGLFDCHENQTNGKIYMF